MLFRAAALVCDLQHDATAALQCKLRECIGFNLEPNPHAADLCAAVLMDALKAAAASEEQPDQYMSLVVCEVRPCHSLEKHG